MAPLDQPSSETRSGATQDCDCSQARAASASATRSRSLRSERERTLHWLPMPREPLLSGSSTTKPSWRGARPSPDSARRARRRSCSGRCNCAGRRPPETGPGPSGRNSTALSRPPLLLRNFDRPRDCPRPTRGWPMLSNGGCGQESEQSAHELENGRINAPQISTSCQAVGSHAMAMDGFHICGRATILDARHRCRGLIRKPTENIFAEPL